MTVYLEKILAAFYLYPKNLTETKLKINGLTSLAAQVIFRGKTLFLGYQAYCVAFQHLTYLFEIVTAPPGALLKLKAKR